MNSRLYCIQSHFSLRGPIQQDLLLTNKSIQTHLNVSSFLPLLPFIWPSSQSHFETFSTSPKKKLVLETPDHSPTVIPRYTSGDLSQSKSVRVSRLSRLRFSYLGTMPIRRHLPTPSRRMRRANTQYFPWRHRNAFLNVGYGNVCVLYQLMHPHNSEAAQLALLIVHYVRSLHNVWGLCAEAPFFLQEELTDHLVSRHRALTPWTEPSIGDMSTVFEVLLHNYANDRLIRSMSQW